MQPKKIYISGKITGLPKKVAEKMFSDAEAELLKKYKKVKIVNPLNINHTHDLSWENFMRFDLIEMMKCDTIYMLKNWKESKGAVIEFELAINLNFNILFQNNG